MRDEITFHRLGLDNASLLDGADVFDNPVDAVQLDTYVANNGHELVFAMVENKVVGFASGTVLLHPDKPPAFFINEVGVNEDMRKHGVATTLTKMLLEVARIAGCKGIWLATESDNFEAQALYSKLEGRLTEAVIVYDWDGAMDE